MRGHVDSLDQNWRENLLTSLVDCKADRENGWGCGIFLIGLLLTVAAVALPRIGKSLAWWYRQELGESGWHEFVASSIFLGSLVGLPVLLRKARNAFFRMSWKIRARSAQDELNRKNCRRPVAYLRSFSLDDHIDSQRSWSERYLGTMPTQTTEQQLAGQLAKVGPVLAIGRPNEELPALGAARFYVSDIQWKEKLKDLLDASQRVVWAIGTSEGLKWEAGQLVENVDPRNLIVWAHPNTLESKESHREREWQQFTSTLGPCFPKPFPKSLGNTQFFVFDPDWNPIPVAAYVKDCFSSPMKSALRRAIRHSKQKQLNSRTADSLALVDTTRLDSIFGLSDTKLQWPLLILFALSLLLSSVFGVWAFNFRINLIEGSLKPFSFEAFKVPIRDCVFVALSLPTAAFIGYRLIGKKKYVASLLTCIIAQINALVFFYLISREFSWTPFVIGFVSTFTFLVVITLRLGQGARLAPTIFLACFISDVSADLSHRAGRTISNASKNLRVEEFIDLFFSEIYFPAQDYSEPMFFPLLVYPLINSLLTMSAFVILIKLIFGRNVPRPAFEMASRETHDVSNHSVENSGIDRTP